MGVNGRRRPVLVFSVAIGWRSHPPARPPRPAGAQAWHLGPRSPHRPDCPADAAAAADRPGPLHERDRLAWRRSARRVPAAASDRLDPGIADTRPVELDPVGLD